MMYRLRKGGNHGVRYVLRWRREDVATQTGMHDACVSGRVRVLRLLHCHFHFWSSAERTGKQMLDLVRAFVGSPLSTFRYLSLPTESLLVSHISPFHPPSSVQLFTALSIRRYSRHPRRHLSPPCPYARLFSGLSQPRSCERADHFPCGRSRVEARMYLSPHHNAFPTHSCLASIHT